MAYFHHMAYSSLGIALDSMEVPLSVLFSGTTTITLLNAALDAERALHTQLKQQNTKLQATVEGLEQCILFNSSVINRYVHHSTKNSFILTNHELQTPIKNTVASSYTSTVILFYLSIMTCS